MRSGPIKTAVRLVVQEQRRSCGEPRILKRIDDLHGVGVVLEANRLRANWPEGLIALAWILATDPDQRYRNGGEAISLVEQAATVPDVRQPMLLDTLAAAFAETGRFEDATTTAQRAVTLAQQLGRTNLALEITKRVDLYTARQPFRSSDSVK